VTARSSDADNAAAVAAYREYGSYAKAGEALGVTRSCVLRRCRRARLNAYRGEVGGPPIPEIAVPPEGFEIVRNSGQYDDLGKLTRQFIQSRRAAGDEYEAPAGHVVKGESALLDADGRVLAKWVKTREGAGDGLIAGLKAAFAEFDGKAPVAPAPDESDDDLLTVYPLPDLHFGMLAWGRETGADYDTKIAAALAVDSVGALVAQSRPSRKAIILGLGDYWHANDAKAITPQSGNALDVDGRWARVFAAGAKLAVALVDMVARKHAEVEVAFLPGNHDPDSAMSLTVALALFYSSNERITVHQEPGIAWYHRFGRVLLGATHGHTIRPAQMAIMLAADRPEDWGMTEHRHFLYGHVHHETANEIGGVRVESFSTPAARDAWNAARFRPGRAMSAITFHREHGEIGRHRVNITTPRAS
jgi:hypothetical protein